MHSHIKDFKVSYELEAFWVYVVMIVVIRDKVKCDMLLENTQPLCEAKWV